MKSKIRKNVFTSADVQFCTQKQVCSKKRKSPRRLNMKKQKKMRVDSGLILETSFHLTGRPVSVVVEDPAIGVPGLGLILGPIK